MKNTNEEPGAEEYRALAEALTRTRPNCQDDPRFTLDLPQLPATEVHYLAKTVCQPCPLWSLCRDYAHVAEPKVGIWAGRTYPNKTNKTKSENTK